MALAPVAYTLWNSILRFDPADPPGPIATASSSRAAMPRCCCTRCCTWPACKAVERRIRSCTASRPSRSTTSSTSASSAAAARAIPNTAGRRGVETTTGPLGQGCGNSVGMAIAQKWLAPTYNRPGFELFDYNVYALCSDGDLMEGIASEAASLAGHLKLDNLCWIYDDNHITIEGETAGLQRRRGHAVRRPGWNVLTFDDANDLGAAGGRGPEQQADLGTRPESLTSLWKILPATGRRETS